MDELRCPYCNAGTFIRVVMYPTRQIISPNVKLERREKTDDYTYVSGENGWYCDNCENPMPDAISKELTRLWVIDERIR